MHAKFERLLNVFRLVAEGQPHDLCTWLEQLPETGALPSPWETWTLIGLVRHRERQLWVGEMIRTRLQGSLLDLATMGAFGHPEGVSQKGSLPGLPEWEYFFHGKGCCISHKVRGDVIDVDFVEDSAEYFDTFFYIDFLESLRSPEAPEQRLRELHRSLRTVRLAIDDLIAAGVLTPLETSRTYPARLANEVLEYREDVDAFCRAWAMPGQRLWLSALIGDWLAAHELASGDSAIHQITAPRTDQCRVRRCDRLLQETGYTAADALFGLAELNAADQALEQAFRSPPSGVVSAALQIVGQQDDARWCPQIFAMFSRLNPQGQHPEPHIWTTSLNYLLRHNCRTKELLASLSHAGGTQIGEAVLIALERAPEHALPLIRKGILSSVPMDRTKVAAILVLIGKPWSIQELLRALKESDEQERTADARAAIREIGDAEAVQAVLDWEQTNPHEDEVGSYVEINGRQHGPLFTLGEHALKDRATWLHFEMDQLHDRVMKIRNVIPADISPGRQWWKLWGH